MIRKPFITVLLFIILLFFCIGCTDDAVFPGNEAEDQPERITSNIVSIPIEKCGR